MISIRNVSMQYELGDSSIRVLDDVDLAVGRGERVAITGPSGSGKTTLLLLAGLERPSGGAVELDGVRVDRLSADELADLRRDHIGIVFQSFHLVPSLNALENVALPLEIAGKRDARARARALLGAVGLSERLAHYPGSSPAASSSASQLRARFRIRRSWCSPTSPPATSMTARSAALPDPARCRKCVVAWRGRGRARQHGEPGTGRALSPAPPARFPCHPVTFQRLNYACTADSYLSWD